MGVRPLIDGVSFDALLADKAFDADWLRLEFDDRGALAVIPPRKNRKQSIQIDIEMYKWRHLVENYFAKIKEFRGTATRYDSVEPQPATTKLTKASAPISTSPQQSSHAAKCSQNLGIGTCRKNLGGKLFQQKLGAIQRLRSPGVQKITNAVVLAILQCNKHNVCMKIVE